MSLTVFLISTAMFGKSVTVKTDRPIQDQFAESYATYIIKSEIDLKGSTLYIPEGATITFKRKGSICNGMIHCCNTLLKGTIHLYCTVSGSIQNKEIPISCLDNGDGRLLEKRIAAILNLENSCEIVLDKDVFLSNGDLVVKRLLMRGNHKVFNSPSFKISGDVIIKEVSFVDFRIKKELFIDLSGQLKPSRISLQSVIFDCGNNIDRVIYKPVKQASLCSISIDNCVFQRINNYAVQFQSDCTGQISNCTIRDHGTNNWGHVICFHLGNNDCYNATKLMIKNNRFSDIQVPYSKNAESREAHAILIYGHENTISDNIVSHLFSTDNPEGDPGKDSEGIYLKGGKNMVVNNELIDCVGSGPDGAITIKSIFADNKIAGNRIQHRFGIGIQCYTPNSRIENNQIESCHKAEAAIALCNNKSSVIDNNSLMLKEENRKSHKAAIELMSCGDITVKNNTSDSPSFVTAYSNTGNIMFETNHLTIKDKTFGTNTYYSSPIELHSDGANYIFVGNIIDLKNIKTSQLIEADSKFKGKVQFDENVINVLDTETEETIIHYLVRNISSVTKKGNQILHKKKEQTSKLKHLL